MKLARWLLVHLVVLVPLSSCKTSGQAPVPGDGAALPPPGRCFGVGVSCRSDGDCSGGGFSTCQEGTCCSGTLGAKDCACLCAGDRACKGGELCCPGRCEQAENRGVVRCRPYQECFDCGL